MANYKGNPNLYKHGFKTDREEACTEQVNVRMPLSLKTKLKQKKNWQEFVRQTLQKALDEDTVDKKTSDS
ncbi:MAG: hypothetical protein QNJ72_30555 [Pleurocapsa sp. MO_226.B13]|nr:hypothetical protein [Pleurocapsa sp. MO_226.B13]